MANTMTIEVVSPERVLYSGTGTMVVTRTEHPPAAALALGLVLNEWDLLTLAVVMAGIVALSLIKRLVLPMLLDLI